MDAVSGAVPEEAQELGYAVRGFPTLILTRRGSQAGPAFSQRLGGTEAEGLRLEAKHLTMDGPRGEKFGTVGGQPSSVGMNDAGGGIKGGLIYYQGPKTEEAVWAWLREHLHYLPTTGS